MVDQHDHTSTAARLLLEVPDETALAIACHLENPLDMLRLGLACKRFSMKTVVATDSSVDAAVAGKHPKSWSVVDEAARRWLAAQPEAERARVPRRVGVDSWLGLKHELMMLASPLMLSRKARGVILTDNGTVATGYAYMTAASKVVMRAGRNYSEFTVIANGGVLCGIIRPGWNVEGQCELGRPRPNQTTDHSFYWPHSGRRDPGYEVWPGTQASQVGDRVGMLLDLTAGTLTVYKNDVSLGVMATGLRGEFCWAVMVSSGSKVRISSAPIPVAARAEEGSGG
jgi:hypothetical protein